MYNIDQIPYEEWPAIILRCYDLLINTNRDEWACPMEVRELAQRRIDLTRRAESGTSGHVIRKRGGLTEC